MRGRPERGRQRELTSEGALTRRSHVPPRLDRRPRGRPPPTFICSPADVGVGAAWVHVAGELDVATTPQLDRTLREAELQTRLVVLDLRDIPFMDASGVHAVVDASVRAREVGRRLLLPRGPPDVDRMFALTGTVHEVEICAVDRRESPGQALRRLTDAARAG